MAGSAFGLDPNHLNPLGPQPAMGDTLRSRGTSAGLRLGDEAGGRAPVMILSCEICATLRRHPYGLSPIRAIEPTLVGAPEHHRRCGP